MESKQSFKSQKNINGGGAGTGGCGLHCETVTRTNATSAPLHILVRVEQPCNNQASCYPHPVERVPLHFSLPSFLCAFLLLSGIGLVESFGIQSFPGTLHTHNMNFNGIPRTFPCLRSTKANPSKMFHKSGNTCPLRTADAFNKQAIKARTATSRLFVASDPQNMFCLSTIATKPGFNFPFSSNSIQTRNISSTSPHGKNGFMKQADVSKKDAAVEQSTEFEVEVEAKDKECFSKSAEHVSQYDTIFSIDIPEGKCVGLVLSNPYQAPTVPTSLDPNMIESNDEHWIKKILHPDEVQYGLEQPSDNARMTFYLGRLAMRTALEEMKGLDSQAPVELKDETFWGFTNVHAPHTNTNTNAKSRSNIKINATTELPTVSTLDQSILKDEHGRPQVPNGFIGSISHKQTTGVALIATLPADADTQSHPTIGVGIDIEQSFSRRRNIAKKILTPNELEDLGGLDGVTRDEEVLLRFSLKESVYKAMHPLISQFVGFQEAEIKPHNDGTATVYLNLKSGKHEKFAEVKAHWRRIEGDFFLTSSSVNLKDEYR